MSDDHNRGMSEHDKDCGRLFIPNDDTANPLYGGFQVMGTQHRSSEDTRALPRTLWRSRRGGARARAATRTVSTGQLIICPCYNSEACVDTAGRCWHAPPPRPGWTRPPPAPSAHSSPPSGGYSPLIGHVATILALIGYMAPILAFDWSGSTSTRTTSRRRSRRTEIRLTTPACRKWASCFITHKLNVEIWNVNFVDTWNKCLLIDGMNRYSKYAALLSQLGHHHGFSAMMTAMIHCLNIWTLP